MLDAFVEKIRALAVEAAGPKVLTPRGEPDHIYLLQDKDGDMHRFTAEAKPRNHTASDLQAIVEFAKRWNDACSVIWFSRHKVVAVLNDDERRDTVTLPLRLSTQIQLLLGLESKANFFKQPELILWLRTIFKNCMVHCANLVTCLRSVKFDNGQVVESTVQHGKSSMGKAIRAEVTALDNIPEYVILEVPIFESGVTGLVCNVELALEPVPESGGFKLIPLPGEIEKAITKAERDIGDFIARALDGVQVPVYFGTP